MMDDLGSKPRRGVVYRLLALVLALVLGWIFWLLYSMRVNQGLHVPPVVYALLLSFSVLSSDFMFCLVEHWDPRGHGLVPGVC